MWIVPLVYEPSVYDDDLPVAVRAKPVEVVCVHYGVIKSEACNYELYSLCGMASTQHTLYSHQIAQWSQALQSRAALSTSLSCRYCRHRSQVPKLPARRLRDHSLMERRVQNSYRGFDILTHLRREREGSPQTAEMRLPLPFRCVDVDSLSCIEELQLATCGDLNLPPGPIPHV